MIHNILFSFLFIISIYVHIKEKTPGLCKTPEGAL